MVFGEPKAEEIANALTDAPMVAPALLWFELASICLKKIGAHPEQADHILEAFSLATHLTIEVVEVDDPEVLELARKTGLTTYDASHVWLARYLHGELVTLDARQLLAGRMIRRDSEFLDLLSTLDNTKPSRSYLDIPQGRRLRSACRLPFGRPLDSMKQLAAGTRINLTFCQGGEPVNSRPLVDLGLRTLARHLRWLAVCHLGVSPDIDALHIVTELDRHAVGVKTVDRMDKTVVDDIRHMESRH